MFKLRGTKGVLQYNNIFCNMSRGGIKKQCIPQKGETVVKEPWQSYKQF